MDDKHDLVATALPAIPMCGATCSKVLKRLAAWEPAYDLPAGVTRDLLAAGLADAEAACAPAGEELALVILDRLFRFARTFGIKIGDTANATAFYLEALDDLPADLLVAAVDQVVRSYRYGHRLPPPADLRGAVAHELVVRQNARIRIGLALDFGRIARRHRQPTVADKARALKMFKAAKAALSR